MTRFLKLDWRSLVVELLVVFIGLFAALQLDDWRQQREFHDAETRYLERLREDLQSFLEYSGEVLVLLERNHAAVRHVSDSFAAGEIIDGDARKFEIGLIYVGMLPALTMQRSSYDEMVASGMFARLRSEQLKRKISELYAMQVTVDQNFTWRRNSVEGLDDQLMSRLNLYSEDAVDQTSSLFTNEPVRRVEYDFVQLREDARIRNGFYWATDTHSDWVHWIRQLADMTEKTVVILEKELEAR